MSTPGPTDQKEGSHLRLVQGLDGGLQELGRRLQVLTVPPPQTSDVLQLLLLLRADPHSHLAFLLLQESEDVVEGFTHLGLLSAAVLLWSRTNLLNSCSTTWYQEL